jgi:hypothetical protein
LDLNPILEEGLMKFLTGMFVLLSAVLAPKVSSGAAGEQPPPVTLNWGGFIQDWSTLGPNSNSEDVNAGNFLKHFRFRMAAEAYDGITVVLVPELAGQSVTQTAGFGFTLLDAYAAFDLSKTMSDWSPPLTITVGQFKTPFGLNRMYTPAQLLLVDYSSIYNGAGGVMRMSSFWDDGIMLTWKQGSWLKMDVAWVEGLGINQAMPGGTAFGTKPSQDFSGKLDLVPAPGLTLGGSIYHGEAYSASGTPGYPGYPKIFSGAHIKYVMSGKSFAAELEYISRSGDNAPTIPQTGNRFGMTAQVSQYLMDQLQLVAGCDAVTDLGTDRNDSTRFLGGVNWYPGGPVRISLQQLGIATGPSAQPTAGVSILQTQVTW